MGCGANIGACRDDVALTATPQKSCHYCNSPAEIIALRCATCGGPLPAAGPMAQIMASPKYWSLRKAGFISAGASAGLAWLSFMQVFGQIALAWVFLFVPTIMVLAAWRNARFAVGTLLGNAFIALGVWVLCVIIWLNMSGIYHGSLF